MRIFFAAAALFTAMQLVPVEMRTNPHSNPAHTMEARIEVPPHIQTMLKTSCANCHSNETRWPWYSSVAPLSWMLARDVNQARSAMNFSDWTSRPGTAMGLLAASCAGVQSQRMPPANYRPLHREAELTPEEAEAFCAWTTSQTRAINPNATKPNTGKPEM